MDNLIFSSIFHPLLHLLLVVVVCYSPSADAATSAKTTATTTTIIASDSHCRDAERSEWVCRELAQKQKRCFKKRYRSDSFARCRRTCRLCVPPGYPSDADDEHYFSYYPITSPTTGGGDGLLCGDKGPGCLLYTNYCTNQYYIEFMMRHCPLSCGYCPTVTTTSSITSALAGDEDDDSKEKFTTTKSPNSLLPSSVALCKDVVGECEELARIGFCESDEQSKEVKRALCAATCRVCGDGDIRNGNTSQPPHETTAILTPAKTAWGRLGRLFLPLSWLYPSIRPRRSSTVINSRLNDRKATPPSTTKLISSLSFPTTSSLNSLLNTAAGISVGQRDSGRTPKRVDWGAPPSSDQCYDRYRDCALLLFPSSSFSSSFSSASFESSLSVASDDDVFDGGASGGSLCGLGRIGAELCRRSCGYCVGEVGDGRKNIPPFSGIIGIPPSGVGFGKKAKFVWPAQPYVKTTGASQRQPQQPQQIETLNGGNPPVLTSVSGTKPPAGRKAGAAAATTTIIIRGRGERERELDDNSGINDSSSSLSDLPFDSSSRSSFSTLHHKTLFLSSSSNDVVDRSWGSGVRSGNDDDNRSSGAFWKKSSRRRRRLRSVSFIPTSTNIKKNSGGGNARLVSRLRKESTSFYTPPDAATSTLLVVNGRRFDLTEGDPLPVEVDRLVDLAAAADADARRRYSTSLEATHRNHRRKRRFHLFDLFSRHVRQSRAVNANAAGRDVVNTGNGKSMDEISLQMDEINRHTPWKLPIRQQQ